MEKMFASWRVSTKVTEQKFLDHVDGAFEDVKNNPIRLISERRPEGYHKQQKYVDSEGHRYIPKQFTYPAHAELSDYAHSAANSYSSILAISKLIEQEGI